VRIASLVPSATEALFALGLGDHVVAVTHECDWPAAARGRPHLTRSVLAPDLPPGEVDAAVRERTAGGEAIYELDRETLERLEPDLIVTQAVCAVCAVSYEEVCSVAAGLPGGPDVLSLDPETLDAVLDDLPVLAEACGERDRGERLRSGLIERLDRVRAAVNGGPRPGVLALEWLDPPYIGGHWVPDMIAAAGGEDPLGRAGAKSRIATWDELRAAAADLVVVMPCGLYADEAAMQAQAHAEDLLSLGVGSMYAVDAASSFSRPGPRLVEGVELLAHLLHPDRSGAPDGLEWRRLDPERTTA
jgi:iron complex transport system substrate-binding protein